MIKAIIVDDEPLSISNLIYVLKSVAPDIEIIYTSNDPEEALPKIEELRPDLVFLDIEMPYMNGFLLYDKISGKKPLVVFVTAFDEYAVMAFKINAVDYLLKPLDIDLIQETIQRVKERLSLDKNSDIEQIVLKTIHSLKNRLSISTTEGVKFVDFNDVIYISSDNSYTTFHLESTDKKIIASKGLKEYEAKLPYNFVRIHHQHIVNTEYIDSYLKGRGGKVLLKNGIELDVSQRKKDSLFRDFI